MTLDDATVEYDIFSDSDDEGDEEDHKRFLTALTRLDKRKRVLPSERREPSLQVSEFHLTKENSDVNTVHLGDLAKSLRLKSSHVDIAKKLKVSQRKAKTLPKPLEKPAAERIRREVAYESVKDQVAQWDPVVYRHRISDNLVFPLKKGDGSHNDTEAFLSPDQGATELERQIAAVLNDSPTVLKEREEKEEYPLSLEEMIQRRKELAKFRAQESYRQAKAHRQNKIKSKSYHRHARRERIRQQIKEFEELQQKDPEAALQRLEEIEKERALERVSLRHRSTGQWARNHAVRAKYDKESRQVLSEQLKLSKDLTQKIKVDSESSGDEDETMENNQVPSDNPWTTQTKTEEEVDAFLSGYRKYWMEKNGHEGSDKAEEKKPEDSQPSSGRVSPQEMDAQQKALLENAVVSYSEEYENGEGSLKSPGTESKSSSKNGSRKDQVGKVLEVGRNSVGVVESTKGQGSGSLPKGGGLSSNSQRSKLNQKLSSGKVNDTTSAPVLKSVSKAPRPKKSSVIAAGGKWIVSPLKTTDTLCSNSISGMFDDLSKKITQKAERKISVLKRDLCNEKQEQEHPKKSKEKKRKAKNSNLLEMKRQKMQIDIDEKLNEGLDDDVNKTTTSLKIANKSVDFIDSHNISNKKSGAVTELDPNKFMKAKPVQLKTAIPDEITGGDEGLDDSDEEGGDKHTLMTISEAFEDDDVVADFSQEKKDVVRKDKPEDINLSLPGWGDWAGHNLKPNKRKNRRFMVKMPTPPPRRDENKGNLIVNESEDAAARAHQVSELPFPFTSVKDFEASVRAPVSNTFIPESAHRKLIKPSVRTMMGAVIEPMGKEVLLKRQQNYKKKNK